MKFDPKKPHGLVYGVTGAAYEQNGQLYTPTGEPFVEEKQEELPLGTQAQRQSTNKQTAKGQ
ncbi:hypothetical protein [Paraburkholderia rhynchosiae]|uniref:Uncharacterized protein n=1 Tax=Paraburkholderia rhynchosiae TaxID=487049 RepID=A0A2N7W9D0_9BURK|nr:hypothetical protein [Paraburkholderia rhynchosiae]PMS26004.1 hypothetical protein C0Z16_28125 [Paraburkholderia rhynchosiae]CAB3731084.1 hypothetical protein LMG27174_05804 [Paraburkholderia rhynchosiae]